MSNKGLPSRAVQKSPPTGLRATRLWKRARSVKIRLWRFLGLSKPLALQAIATKPAARPALAKPGSPKPPPAPSTLYNLAQGHARTLARKVVALYIGDGAGAEFHVDLWLEYMQESEREVLVIVRSPFVFNVLKTRNDLDVVYVKEARDAEVLLTKCPKLKAVLYTSNTGNAIHFLRNNQLLHVFVGHGDSEKSASCHKFFRVYDEVWTAGQAHIDRFGNSGINFDGLRLVAVGRPSLASILEQSTETVFGRFLYLPTWEGFYNEQLYSSVGEGIQFLQNISLATGKQPVVKFHPWTGKQKKEFENCETTYRRAFPENCVTIIGRSSSVVNAVRDVDFLIADISSVVTDFLPTQRPIFLYAPSDSGVRVAPSSMSYSEYCYEFADANSLLRLIEQVIVSGDDFLKDNRRKALEYFIDVGATRSDGFSRELDRVTGMVDAASP
ncbi:MAG TPA: CDP-glycerol glycerophosphotransferase family protein [Rhizomicrobium sp.]|jgi:hypothetical protein